MDVNIAIACMTVEIDKNVTFTLTRPSNAARQTSISITGIAVRAKVRFSILLDE